MTAAPFLKMMYIVILLIKGTKVKTCPFADSVLDLVEHHLQLILQTQLFSSIVGLGR